MILKFFSGKKQLIKVILPIIFFLFLFLKTVYFKSPNVLSNPSVQTEFDNHTASLVTYSSLSNDTLSMHFYIANANDFFFKLIFLSHWEIFL